MIRRRRLLHAAGSVGLGLVAGCVGEGTQGPTGDGGGGDGGGDGEMRVDEWLSNTGNYDAVADSTGTSSVTISVGAKGNAGSNAFDPAAVEISPGTTVTWKWVDGYHNVVDRAGAFDSGSPAEDATFERTFETSGTVLYYCKPHKSLGMKGAIVVADAESPGTESN